MTATSRSSYGWRSVSAGSSATGCVRAVVSPSISKSILILKSLSVGSWRTEVAPASSASTFSVPSSPSRESGSTAIVNHRLNSWLRR